MTIGSSSAETDDEFLFDCFVGHPAVERCSSTTSHGMVIAGRTGAGKTAVIRYIERNNTRVAVVDPSEMSLEYVSNSNSIRFAQAIGADLDLMFMALWKHVICIELIRLIYSVNTEEKSKNVFQRIVERFVKDDRRKRAIDYLRVWEGKFWTTMDKNIKEVAEGYENKLYSILGSEIEKFSQGGQYEKRISDDKKLEYVAQIRRVINADQLADLAGVIDMLSEASFASNMKHYILIDKLDERWVDVSIRFRLIRALIESLKPFKRIQNLKILVALRADILERVVQESGDLSFQREKLEDYFVKIKWSKHQLKKLLTQGSTFYSAGNIQLERHLDSKTFARIA